MRILLVTSEALPYIKSGGLADFIYSFGKALAQRGKEVSVILPLYKSIREKHPEVLTELFDTFDFRMDWRTQGCGVFHHKTNGIDYYFTAMDRFDRDGMARFRHGWCRFADDETLTAVLERLQHHGGIYVRLILEEPLTLWNTVKKALGLKTTQKPDPVGEYYFPRRCALYQKTYRGITFLGGYRKYDWARLYDFGTDGIPLHQHVSSMDPAAPWWQRLFPRLYARKHNSANLQVPQLGINLFDFI